MKKYASFCLLSKRKTTNDKFKDILHGCLCVIRTDLASVSNEEALMAIAYAHGHYYCMAWIDDSRSVTTPQSLQKHLLSNLSFTKSAYYAKFVV